MTEQHGTVAGSERHKRRGEPLCEPCRIARNEYMRQFRRGRGRVEYMTYSRARTRALWRLVGAHREEFARYLTDERGQARSEVEREQAS